MIPRGTDQKLHRRPPAFREKSGNHNLLFCLGLIIFACVCILISPAEAGSGDLTARPDCMTGGVPGGSGDCENSLLTGIAIAPPGDHRGDATRERVWA